VCENAQTTIDSAILLESAVHYVWRLGELGQVIGRCMCCVIAGNLLDLATRTHSKPDSSADREKCDERLQQIASKVFAELTKPSSSSEATPLHRWEKAARMFLKKTIITEKHALIGAYSQLQQLVPFVTRCLKRGSTKLYSFATASSSPVRSQLHAQISARCVRDPISCAHVIIYLPIYMLACARLLQLRCILLYTATAPI
jgi:hypothetical protein